MAARIRRELLGMPGIVDTDVFTAGYGNYVIVQTDGNAAWRARQVPGLAVNRQSGIPGALGMIDQATGVKVYFQPRGYGVDITSAPYDARVGQWVEKAKNDPGYRDAVTILREATSVDYRYEQAEAVLASDGLFSAIDGTDPNRRMAARPPKKGSDFHACSGFTSGGRHHGGLR